MKSKIDLFTRRINMEKAIIEEIIITETTSVLVTTNTAYNHTEFDDVIAAWKEQEFQKKKAKRKLNILSLFKRKEVA